MSKTARYALALLVCAICFAVSIALMVFTGIGGVLVMVLLFSFIKKIWNGIVHYGEESKSYANDNEESESETLPDEDSQEL